MELLYIKNASERVDAFVGYTDVVHESNLAVDSMDCDAFLYEGIESFKYIQMVETVIRRAIFTGKEVEISESELDEAVSRMLNRWAGVVQHAEDWVCRCLANGYQLDNLVAFRNCVAEVRGILSFSETVPANESILVLGASALEEHRRGETVEWVPGEE